MAVAALFGLYDQVSRFLPAEWVQNMPPWLPEIVAVTALLVGPFLAFRKKSIEVDLLTARFREKRQIEFKMAIVAARLALEIGERSPYTLRRRFDRGEARLKELRAEVESGDFSNALEILVFKDVFLDVAAQMIPPAAAGYRNLHTELCALVSIVESHLEEVAEEVAN